MSTPSSSPRTDEYDTADSSLSSSSGNNPFPFLPPVQDGYEQLSIIGNGAYGTVYLGRDRKSQDLVAVKKIKILLTDDGVPVHALREISMLKQLEKFDHPNVVKLLDICHGKLNREDRMSLALVFEYVDHDLYKYTKEYPAPGLEPERIQSLMHQILCGIDFLHTNRVVHRDMKPQNILITRNHKVKIADFGLARIYDFYMHFTTMVVTLWYRSPEILLCNNYATPVDIWSCGCIMAELYRKRALFEGQNEGDQLQRIFDVLGRPRDDEWPADISLSINNFAHHSVRDWKEIVPDISKDGLDLLKKMLTFDQNKRINAYEALDHPFFHGLVAPKASFNGFQRPVVATAATAAAAAPPSTPGRLPRPIDQQVAPVSFNNTPSDVVVDDAGPSEAADTSNILAGIPLRQPILQDLVGSVEDRKRLLSENTTDPSPKRLKSSHSGTTSDHHVSVMPSSFGVATPLSTSGLRGPRPEIDLRCDEGLPLTPGLEACYMIRPPSLECTENMPDTPANQATPVSLMCEETLPETPRARPSVAVSISSTEVPRQSAIHPRAGTIPILSMPTSTLMCEESMPETPVMGGTHSVFHKIPSRRSQQPTTNDENNPNAGNQGPADSSASTSETAAVLVEQKLSDRLTPKASVADTPNKS